MRELNIEQRLTSIEKNIVAIKGMLEKFLNQQVDQSVKENNEIMSVKQVGHLLGLDVNIIYAKCSKGDIPYFKLGRQYRFKKEQILKWLKDQKDSPQFSVDDYVDRYIQSHVLKS